MIPVKLRLLLGGIILLGIISLFGMVIEESQAQKTNPEKDDFPKNSVNDEVFQTIHVELADGISSADDIR